jgi:hypothetical protein
MPTEPAPSPGAQEPEVLLGGVANAGSVLRVGDEVVRPAGPHQPSIAHFLRYLSVEGFDGASKPIAVSDGRERLRFIPGDVAIPPYPVWAQTDEALASVARLLRRFHDAARCYVAEADASWSTEMADPDAFGGQPLVMCHNDVCLENVVFRDGTAVALLDFDYVAPGRPAYDLAQFARMCVPMDPTPERWGWQPADPAARLTLIAEVYGLGQSERVEFFAALAGGIARGGRFVLRQVERGDPNFIAMWDAMGGMAMFDARRLWFDAQADTFRRALGIG